VRLGNVYMDFFAPIFCCTTICNYCNVYMGFFLVYIGVFVFLYMRFYVTHITLDSIYEFLNTVLMYITLDSIYRFLNKRINIY
jgi:hypothetical protein